MKRLREFLESIAFAGLKPSGGKPDPGKRPRFAGLRARIDQFLAGGPAPSDPLYLTNRSAGQKMKSWIFIGLPCFILIAGIGVALSNILEPPEPKPVVEPTAKEVAAKTLPNFDNNLKIEPNNDVEVVEVKVVHAGGSRVVGLVRNNTSHAIPKAHMVIDLTDINGSQVGGVEVHMEDLPASKTKTFSTPIAQHSAAFVLVREIGPVK